jgi:hypothetical protein
MPFDERMKSTFEKAKTDRGARSAWNSWRAAQAARRMEILSRRSAFPLLDGMGAVGEGYHSEREFIFADSLEQKTKLIAELIEKW